MSEKNEIIEAHGHQIEKSVVLDVPVEVALPKAEERLVIGATPKGETEQPQGGLEIVSLADYPRDIEGRIDYHGIKISGGDPIEALLIDPLVPINAENATGYKAIRKGEVISADKLARRFGKETGFGIAMDENGKLVIENTRPGTPVDVLSIKPIENNQDIDTQAAESARKLMGVEETDEEAPESLEAIAELHVEAAEDIGETAAAQVVDFEEEPEAEKEKSHEPTLEQILFEGKAQYDRQLDGIIRTTSEEVTHGISRMEAAAQEFDGSVRSFNHLEDDATSLRKIVAGIENSVYNDDGVRTLLTRLDESLQGTYNRARGAIEGGVNDTLRPLTAVKKALQDAEAAITVQDQGLNEFVQSEMQKHQDDAETVKAPESTGGEFTAKIASTSDILAEIEAIPSANKSEIEEKLRTLYGIIGHLNVMKDESRVRGFDANEIRMVAAQVENLSKDNQQLLISGKLEQHIADIRGTLRVQ